MTTDPNTPDAAEPVDVAALFRQLRAMQYRTDAMSVIDALEAAVMPLPDRVEQPGDVLLVGRITGGPALAEPVIAVCVGGAAPGPWFLPTAPHDVTWVTRSDLSDVTPAHVVPAAVLEDIAQHAHRIAHAEFDAPHPIRTVEQHRADAQDITDLVDTILTGGA